MENKEGFPLLGDKFPSMEVKTTHGKMKLPEDMKGKWFVLFSHPGDFTPVCTTEFIAFSKMAPQFKKINTELIGLSVDQVFSHIKWAEWIEDKMKVKVPFPIVADEQGLVGKRLGMIHPGKGTATVRAVFIVDPKGVLRIILYYPPEVGRNMDEILRAVKALQVADKNKVAMPANWPENEILKDRVIMPPAGDVKTANSRRGKKDCYDWWFCHKKLNRKK